MGTKHVIVGHAGKLSAETLRQIEEAYERDLASGPAEGKPEEAEKTETADKGEGDKAE